MPVHYLHRLYVFTIKDKLFIEMGSLGVLLKCISKKNHNVLEMVIFIEMYEVQISNQIQIAYLIRNKRSLY